MMFDKAIVRGLLLAAVVASAVAAQAAVTLTFDDLPGSSFSSYSVVPNGYGGLNWVNLNVMRGLDRVPSGYYNGVVSPENVVFNGNGNPAAISGDPFTFNSAYFTAAWNDGLHIRADASLGGTLVYSKEFIVDTTGPTLETFNWSGIDTILFTSSGGTHHPGYYIGLGTHFAMDNFTFNEPIPEPSTLIIWSLLGGLAVTVGWYRRRKPA